MLIAAHLIITLVSFPSFIPLRLIVPARSTSPPPEQSPPMTSPTPPTVEQLSP